MKRALFALGLIAVGLIPISCSEERAERQTDEFGWELPAVYESQLTGQYSALGDSAYALLEEGKTEEAVAVFKAQAELIPAGKWGAYNVACAYGRSGRVDEGIEWLTRAVDGGWDDPEHLAEDPDLESLRADPRFDALRDRAGETHAARTALFAAGLPKPEGPIPVFPDADSLENWARGERRELSRQRRVWHGWQSAAARMDLDARRLAALRSLRGDDPDFDYGLERIRAISEVFSPYQSWGAVSDGVLTEVNDYLAGDPSAEGRSEAHYRAAVAEYMRSIPRTSRDGDWGRIAAAARRHLSHVEPGTRYEGPSVAVGLVLDLEEAGADGGDLLPRVREFVDAFREDRTAMGVAGRFFQQECLQAVWPIPLDAVDIDGRPVSLDQYEGKVVLIDFWAIWCGPCRVELPHLVDAYERFASHGFEILSISLDRPEDHTTEQYRAWAGENGMIWRHVYDQKSWESPLVNAFLIQSIPAPILIGTDGSIVAMEEDCRGERLAESIRLALGITPA